MDAPRRGPAQQASSSPSENDAARINATRNLLASDIRSPMTVCRRHPSARSLNVERGARSGSPHGKQDGHGDAVEGGVQDDRRGE